MYAVRVKCDFMDNFSYKERGLHRPAFVLFEPFERSLDKDICQMNREELSYVLMECDFSNEAKMNKTINTLYLYLEWASENYADSIGYNVLEEMNIDNMPILKGLSAKKFITYDQLTTIEDILINKMDAVIFRLVFEGVLGWYYSELLNIRYNDINFNTGDTILYDNDGNKRVKQLSNRALELVESAFNEKYRIIYNIDGTPGLSYELENTDYLFRRMVNKGHVEQIKTESLLPSRVKLSRRFLMLPHVNIESIFQSSILFIGYLSIKENGGISSKELNNIKEMYLPHYSRKYYASLVEDVLTPENMWNVYGVQFSGITS